MTFTSVSRKAFSVLVLASVGALAMAAKERRQFEWSPISPEELAIKDCPGDPGCPAIMLFREVQKDDTELTEFHHFRIKVLSEEGKKYADVQIPFSEKYYRLEDIRARTVLPDGNRFDFNGQIFDKVIAKTKRLNVQAKTFTLPQVETGSIIEYSYTVKWRKNIPDAFRHPENYLIEGAHSFPAADWIIPYSLFTRHARFSLRPAENVNLQSVVSHFPGKFRPQREADGTLVLDVKNIDAFREENFMPPEESLKTRVSLFYVLGFLGNSDRYWEYQAKQLGADVEKFIGDSKKIKRESAGLVKDNDHPETKVRRIYERVQQLRYLSFEPAKGRKEKARENLKENKNAEDVLERGYARANEANLLFVALVRAAGLKAFAVAVSSRRNQFFSQDRLDPGQLDSLVVAVQMGSKERYYDPATLYCPYGILPWNESGVRGYRLSESWGARLTTSHLESNDAIVKREALFDLDGEGALRGTLRVEFVGQEALERRLDNYDEDASGRRKALEDEVKSWLPAGAQVELNSEPQWETSQMSLSASFEVKIIDFAMATGTRLLLPPAVFQTTKKYPFEKTRRDHPIYFRYPFQVHDDLTFNIPDGYEVESLPEKREKTFPFGRYEISREAQGRVLCLVRRLVMDRNLFGVNEYSALRIFYDNVRAGDEQQVVLKSVETAKAD